MYRELMDTFYGLPVVDFNGAEDWKGATHAYRLREEYDDELSCARRLEMLLQQDGSSEIQALIIGAWSGACEGSGSAEVITDLQNAAARLVDLRGLFLGEMTFEECEVSWINQSDVSPLLTSFPNLETLRIRGGSGLVFSPVTHGSLKELAIETGGLPRSVLRELFQCQFPALEHLELLLGETNYGFDGGVEDLQPVLSGRLYPKLKYLGLMNSTITNDIAAVVVNSPIVQRIETLDLSMGTLDDEGVQSLHALSEARQLKRLGFAHHYASEAAVAALKAAVHCEVDASDAQSPEDDWRPIVHAE